MVNYDIERGITVFTSSGGSGEEEGSGKTKSQFIIAEATPTDSGNYTCKPSNAVAASIQVFVSNTRGMFSKSHKKECCKVRNRQKNFKEMLI